MDIWKQIVNQSNEPILLFNQKGEITYKNIAAKGILKNKIQDVIPLKNPFKKCSGKQSIVFKRKKILCSYAIEKHQNGFILYFSQISKHLIGQLKELEEANTLLLEKLEQNKNAFHQIIHDLRNPLSPMVTLLQLIVAEEKDRKKKEKLRIIYSNGMYLVNLLNNFLSRIKAEKGEIVLVYEKTDINQLLNEIFTLQSVSTKANQISLSKKVDTLPKIAIDRVKMREVIDNLIKNAIKYIGNGDHIQLIAKATKANIYIHIKDNGIGISKANQKKIFKEFYREGNAEFSIGLGLHISKKIVELHGGEIWAESEGKNKGSTFHIKLPYKSKN